MSRATWRRLPATLVTVLALVLPAGCVGLPESGPVVSTGESQEVTQSSGVTYDPLPPLTDASQAEIVDGFLDAMTAVPIQTTSAAEFLTQEARTSWRPERQTITYGERTAPTGSTRVTVRVLEGGNRFDARGSWRGPLAEDELAIGFDLELEHGQWRIAGLPDALVVPESWFEERFRRFSLGFFDPSGRIIVPEPVFVANDDALATRLVEGLLDGPGDLARGSRSFFPPGTRLELSVPVSEDGVADVSLSDVGRLTPQAMRLMVAQLATTLRQVAGIEALRLTLDDQPVQVPGADDGRFPIGLGQELDPSVPDASAVVFGLRAGLLVAGIPEALDAVSGPFGSGALGVRSFAVDLAGDTIAGVASSGTSLLVGPVYGEEGEAREVLSSARDLLEPSWDFGDRLWVIDRREGRARVLYRQDGRFDDLDVPGVSGEDVRSFLVSRDGSRLVAVVRAGGHDVLRLSRIEHDDQGEVVGAAPAATILGATGETRAIRDIAWQTPTSVAALMKVTGELWEVRSVAVDGAPTSIDSLSTLSGPVRSLVGSPVPEQGLVVLTRDAAIEVSASRTRRIPLQEAVQTLEYVG